jgi:hypothetical protein
MFLSHQAVCGYQIYAAGASKRVRNRQANGVEGGHDAALNARSRCFVQLGAILDLAG